MPTPLSVEQVSAAIADRSARNARSEDRRAEQDIEADIKTTRAARVILKSILDGESYVNLDAIKREWLPLAAHREIFDYALSRKGEKLSVGSLMSYVDHSAEMDALIGLPLPDDEGIRERMYQDCLLCVANAYIAARLKALNDSYARLADPAEKRETVKQIAELQKKLKAKLIIEKL